MIQSTPPARSEWHQVPAGEIHHGTFTEVYGFEFRPGWAFRCGGCAQVGVGYQTPGGAKRGAAAHQRKDHPSAKVVELEATERSLKIAAASPFDLALLDA